MIITEWEKRKAWYKKNRARRQAYWLVWRLRLKQETLAHYGGAKCKNCLEERIELLTLDHIKEDGRDHRRATAKKHHGGGGIQFYSWLKKHGFPNIPALQVLCMNCNLLKRWGKI